jgi:hypothetical protein
MDFKPLTEDEFNELQRVVLPPTRARAGWRIDLQAIKTAIDILEIKYPVRIRYIRGKYRRGTHYARKEYHTITLSQDRPMKQANDTLWHELAHAQQAERFEERTGRPMRHFYREEYLESQGPWGASYQENFYEIDANEVAKEYGDIQLLKEVKQ